MASAAAAAAVSATKQDIIRAYRRILRGGYKAVQYSTPARYVVRDQVRAAFREAAPSPSPSPSAYPGPSSATSTAAVEAAGFDSGVAKRTAWFLEAAGRDRGVEHRVVKNLVKVRLRREGPLKRWKVVLREEKNRKLKESNQGVYDHYDMTIAMLNKSLGIALR